MSRHGVDSSAVAENIAWHPVGKNSEPPAVRKVAQILVKQWMNPPGHRANLLNPNFTHFGGAVRSAHFLDQAWCAYGVQVFVVPRGRFQSDARSKGAHRRFAIAPRGSLTRGHSYG